MRLIANKLLPEIMLTEAIEDFAIRELRKLTDLRPAKRPKVESQEALPLGDGEMPQKQIQSGQEGHQTKGRSEISGNGAKHQRPEDAAVAGRSPAELSPDDAAQRIAKKQRTDDSASMDVSEETHLDGQQPNGSTQHTSQRPCGQARKFEPSLICTILLKVSHWRMTMIAFCPRTCQ